MNSYIQRFLEELDSQQTTPIDDIDFLYNYPIYTDSEIYDPPPLYTPTQQYIPYNPYPIAAREAADNIIASLVANQVIPPPPRYPPPPPPQEITVEAIPVGPRPRDLRDDFIPKKRRKSSRMSSGKMGGKRTKKKRY